jgi:hypothetical protein
MHIDTDGASAPTYEGPLSEDEIIKPFPIDLVPEVFRDLAKSVATTHNAHDKLAAIVIPMIATASAALGKGLAVSTEKHGITYPNLFTYVDARSGIIKSIALGVATAPVVKFNEEYKEYFDEFIKPKIAAKKATAMSDRKSLISEYEKKSRDKDDIERELAKAERIIDQCENVQYFPVKSNDHTPEALVKKGIIRGHVFVATDEAGMVEQVIKGKYKEGSDECLYCNMYSVSSHDRERVDSYDSTPGIAGRIQTMVTTLTMLQLGKMQRVPGGYRFEPGRRPLASVDHCSATEHLKQRA